MKSTVIVPTNIAVVKYWGQNPNWKGYVIPTKSSVSFTVEDLYTKTTVEATKKAKADPLVDFTLNGKKVAPTSQEQKFTDDFIARVGALYAFVKQYDYKIVSENNFPTAAGFASSASGFAALAKGITSAIEEFAPVKDKDNVISALARLGSGSATRSIPSKGGFVQWKRGINPDDKIDPAKLSAAKLKEAVLSSYAETLFEPQHWPEFRIIHVTVDADRKKIASRVGMEETVKTNPYYYDWVNYEESEILPAVIDSVKKNNFQKFAKLAMQASNGLHATCMSTYPAINYLNDVSWEIINAIHDLNKNDIKAAYTYDAGANAVIFTLDKNVDEVAGLLADVVGKGKTHVARIGKGPVFSDEHLF